MESQSTMRADARRNRAAILTAAQDLFARSGPSTPLDEIAKAAGVGAGTVYRHFPTKEALLTAVMDRRMRRLVTVVDEALDKPDPARGFADFLAFILDDALRNEVLCGAMAEQKRWQDSADVRMRAGCEDRVATLLRRAQAAGAVRADVTAHMVLALVAGYVTMVRNLRQETAGEEAGTARRLVWDALRVPVIRNADDPRNETPRVGNETSEGRNETSENCRVCGGALPRAETGRPPVYCSSACRQKAHRRRRATK